MEVLCDYDYKGCRLDVGTGSFEVFMQTPLCAHYANEDCQDVYKQIGSFKTAEMVEKIIKERIYYECNVVVYL